MSALKALSAAKRSKTAASVDASVADSPGSGGAADEASAAESHASTGPAAMHRWFCPWVSTRVALPNLPAELVAWDGSADDSVAPSASAGVVAMAMAPVAVAERRRTIEALQMLARHDDGGPRRPKAEGAKSKGATSRGWVAMLVALVLATV
jgi:hypothetical protein